MLTKRAALMAGLLLGSSAYLSAQDTNQPQSALPEGGPGHQPGITLGDGNTNSQSPQLMRINKGSSLIGATVRNQQGEELGKIRDLVIDFNSGQVAYLVLDNTIGLLSSRKLHAVPVRAFQPDSAGTFLVLNADKAKLMASEGFDKGNWPAATTAAWGAEPFWQEIQSTPGEHLNIKDQQIKENKETIAPLKAEPQPQP